MENLVTIVPNEWNIKHVARHIIRKGEPHQRIEKTFSLFDLGDLLNKMKGWYRYMPRVTPYYAVKCNYHPIVLEILAAYGAGFDCASKIELDKALRTGVSPKKIVFAHTVKPISHIEHARQNGVDLLTFDGEIELLKFKNTFPEARLLLRIRSDAKVATNPLGQKFGCCPFTEAVNLMKIAYDYNLQVVGVCFHVGSGCKEAEAFNRAIQEAARLFLEGKKIGHDMNILDIGGGFPGDRDSSIEEISSVVNKALDEFFPVCSGVKIIAEPGRYFVASAFTLACLVHSARKLSKCEELIENERVQNPKNIMYFLDNGLYGSFAGITSNRLIIDPEPLEDINEPPRLCSLWGPTCDGIDVIAKNILLPPLPLPSWLLFHSFGAYTSTTSTNFNGYENPTDYAFATRSTWEELVQSPIIRERQCIKPLSVGFTIPHSLTPTRPTINVDTPPRMADVFKAPLPVKEPSPMHQILSPTSTDDISIDISITSIRSNDNNIAETSHILSNTSGPNIVLNDLSISSENQKNLEQCCTVSSTLYNSPIRKIGGN